MPLDPRIPLGVQAPQVQPFDVAKPLVTLAQLQRMQTEQQMAAGQLAEAGERRTDTRRMRDIFRQNVQTDPATGKPTLNKMAAIGQLYAVNPEAAAQMDHQLQQENLAAEKAQRETKKAQLEELQKRNDIYTNVALWVKGQKTQEAWDAGVAYLKSLNLPVPPQFEGTVYNDAALDQTIGLLQDAKERGALALQEAQLAETQQRTRMAPEKFTEEKRQFEVSQATTRAGQAIAAGAQERAAAMQAAGQIRAAEIARTEKPLEGTAAGEVAQLDTAMELMNKAMRLYKPQYVGPLEGRAAAVRERYTGEMAPGEVDFRRSINDVSDLLIRERSGAAVGERKEYDRLLGMTPDVTLPDKVFQARAKSFMEAVQTFRANKLKVATTGRAQLGREAPQPVPTPAGSTPAAPVPGTPQPPAAGAPTAKRATRAEAAALAQRHGKSVEQVIQDLQGKGYTVD